MGALEVVLEKVRWPGAGEPAQGHGSSVERSAESLRILMAAGGTGGHIFPALAVAEELRRRAEGRGLSRTAPQGVSRTDSEIHFLGAGRGIESRVVSAAGFPLRTLPAAGLKGIRGWRWLVNLLVLPRSAVEAALMLRELQPHVVVGLGGYVAGPVMLEAALRDVPTLLIEPNAVPGFTNRLLAPVVRLAAVGFEQAAAFYGSKARVTGHPVRKAFYEIPPKTHTPPFTVLILGGSQGSRAINQCVVKSLPLFAADGEPLRFIHQTGERDYDAVQEAYRHHGIPAEVQPFIESTPTAFAGADVIIGRAGAMTVAELAAAGKAAVLIPFADAADHHQLENAKAMERAGAARLLEEPQLTPQRLVGEIRDLLGRLECLGEMERRARSLARPDAAARIADLVEDLAARGR